jgi:hypothetical protein
VICSNQNVAELSSPTIFQIGLFLFCEFDGKGVEAQDADALLLNSALRDVQAESSKLFS